MGPLELWILIIAFVALIWVIARAVVKASNKAANKPKNIDEPMAILKLRLSKGEITEAEFESIKNKLAV
jgi:uncharacterized membrane protein